jgi:type 1 glutamine amidotransferase
LVINGDYQYCQRPATFCGTFETFCDISKCSFTYSTFSGGTTNDFPGWQTLSYTVEQRELIVKMYFLCESVLEAQRNYQQHFNVHDVPSRTCVMCLVAT